MPEPVRCRWCGHKIALVDILVGEPRWQHTIHKSEFTRLHCISWPYPPAEPEPWTLEVNHA